MQQRIHRHTFLGGLTAAAAGGAILAHAETLCGEPPTMPAAGGQMRAILLSREGSDRATGYGMSGKVVSCGRSRLLCSWLDVARCNRWALIDAEHGEIVGSGPVGPARTDNHCGVALCTAPDGDTHCIVGAHGGSFMHYRMPGSEAGTAWQLEQED